MTMTSSKAIAGGVSASMVTVANWLLTLIPGWATIPDEPRAALQFIVVTAIAAATVYLAPANAVKIRPTPLTPPRG